MRRILTIAVVCALAAPTLGFAAESSALQNLRANAKAGNVEAMYELGDSLDEGKDGVTNDPEALSWFEKAAAKGNIDAAARAAYMYDEGEGTKIDDIKAAQLYLKAANGGNLSSQLRSTT